jgi:hypothetical protein
MGGPEDKETLRSLVLRAIADDYEDCQMVIHEVNKWAVERDLSFSASEISNAVVAVVVQGLASAWQLGDSPLRIQVTNQSLGRDIYFIISAAGKKAMGYE